jgi:hypothetical protein
MAIRRLASVLTLVLPGVAAAQTYTADGRSGCRVVNAHPQPNETITWTGECRGGVAEGKGILQWFEDGRLTERYVGEMGAGVMSGQGDLLTHGGHYVGAFSNGKANGQGTLTTTKGETLSGTWKDGCLNDNGHRAWVGVKPDACR